MCSHLKRYIASYRQMISDGCLRNYWFSDLYIFNKEITKRRIRESMTSGVCDIGIIVALGG